MTSAIDAVAAVIAPPMKTPVTTVRFFASSNERSIASA